MGLRSCKAPRKIPARPEDDSLYAIPSVCRLNGLIVPKKQKPQRWKIASCQVEILSLFPHCFHFRYPKPRRSLPRLHSFPGFPVNNHLVVVDGPFVKDEGGNACALPPGLFLLVYGI
jgi:hypothetical protein